MSASAPVDTNRSTAIFGTFPTLADNRAGLAFSESNAYVQKVDLTDLHAKPPHVKIEHTDLFINNEFVPAKSGKRFNSINPTNGEVMASLAEADAADVDIAVKAARVAYETVWKFVGPNARANLMLRLAELMEKNINTLAALESHDNGKTYGIAKAVDLTECINTIRYFGGWASKIEGKSIQVDGTYDVKTVHEPFGVVGAIIPWNFPMLMLCWKFGPCLATGNCLVLKTSEKTPVTALYFASLVKEAGFPPGVVNILSGYGPTAGAALAKHMDVDKVAFTGSTAVGRQLLHYSADSNLKKVTLELGGKSPAIIFPDVDLDAAVAGAAFGIFFNAAQCCCAASRTYVHESVYDEFVARSKKHAASITLSCQSNDMMSMGPIVDETQHKKVLGFIDAGKTDGAHLETGGSKGSDKGFYVQPTVFSGVTDNMRIARDEIFGPVQSIFKFSTIEEVVARANDTQYGLAASVWTNDLDVASIMSANLKAGTVWINCHNALLRAVPFGGYKQSGMGRDLGEYALHEYTQVKSIIQQTSKGIPPMPKKRQA